MIVNLLNQREDGYRNLRMDFGTFEMLYKPDLINDELEFLVTDIGQQIICAVSFIFYVTTCISPSKKT